MIALIDQPTSLQDQDQVRPADLAETMGDNEGRSLAADASHGCLNFLFGFAVNGTGAVIQYQNPGVGQKGPGYSQPLLLTARQHGPAFADFSLIPPRKTADKLVRLGFLSGVLDVLE